MINVFCVAIVVKKFILISLGRLRAPTHFQKPFSILFQYLFNTTWKHFNTITYLHFTKILFIEHNARDICKTVISGKAQNLNKQMAQFVISILFQYFIYILAKFNTFSRSWKPISQSNTFSLLRGNHVGFSYVILHRSKMLLVLTTKLCICAACCLDSQMELKVQSRSQGLGLRGAIYIFKGEKFVFILCWNQFFWAQKYINHVANKFVIMKENFHHGILLWALSGLLIW